MAAVVQDGLAGRRVQQAAERGRVEPGPGEPEVQIAAKEALGANFTGARVASVVRVT
ncbi:hypothetical protein ACF08O_25235 [Streptomyces paradoxus]|uniref:hypothetical protein n=1 Tax=Streptomyces paradoxus TaxID=66375 RepID=UPI0036FCB2A4